MKSNLLDKINIKGNEYFFHITNESLGDGLDIVDDVVTLSNNIKVNTTLVYDNAQNTLTFTTENVKGEKTENVITLNSFQIVDNVKYDAEKEEIVITFITQKGEESELKIPVSSIIAEWNVNNDNNTVSLAKERNVSGIDILTANVNVSDKDGNKLSVIDNALFVADYDDTDVKSLITSENTRATIAEENLQANIDAVAESIPSLDGYATESWVNAHGYVQWVNRDGRKHIVLDNHNNIIGKGTDGSEYNVAMVSKWNVADFGSNAIHLNLNTKDSVTINDNENVATESWVEGKGYLTEHQSLEDYAKKEDIPSLDGYATEEWVEEQDYIQWDERGERKHIVLGNHNNIIGKGTDGGEYNVAMISKWNVADFGSSAIHLNLNSNDKVTINDSEKVATESWVEDKGYLTEHQSLDGYATEEWVEDKGYLTEHQSLDGYAKKEDIPSLDGYATESWVENKGYLTEHQSLDGYATEEWVEGKGYLTEHQSLEDYAKKEELSDEVTRATAKEDEINNLIEQLQSELAKLKKKNANWSGETVSNGNYFIYNAARGEFLRSKYTYNENHIPTLWTITIDGDNISIFNPYDNNYHSIRKRSISGYELKYESTKYDLHFANFDFDIQNFVNIEGQGYKLYLDNQVLCANDSSTDTELELQTNDSTFGVWYFISEEQFNGKMR